MIDKLILIYNRNELILDMIKYFNNKIKEQLNQHKQYETRNLKA